jgi:hypothetical protein
MASRLQFDFFRGLQISNNQVGNQGQGQRDELSFHGCDPEEKKSIGKKAEEDGTGHQLFITQGKSAAGVT